MDSKNSVAMGDVNGHDAKVSDRAGMGRLGRKSVKGKRLLNFSVRNNLVIGNMWHKKRRVIS